MWNCVGASVRGTSHQQTGKPCQDHCAWQAGELGGERVLLISIADGAGSAARSEAGSRLVVETLLHEASHHDGPLAGINAGDAARWLMRTRMRIEAAALEHGCGPEAFAATALLAILGEDRAMFMQLGDGGWVLEDLAGFRAATWPQTGEYANVTVFVTSAGAQEQVQFFTVEAPLRAVAGFTDGVQALCLDLAARRPHGPFFTRVLAPLRACEDATELNAPLLALLDSALFNERTDDDKTLVLACREDAVTSAEPCVASGPTTTDADELGR